MRTNAMSVSVSLSTCLSVCLSVCPLAYLKQNHTSKLHEIFHTYCSGPWLDPPLTTVEYVMFFHVLPVLWMNDVMFSSNGPYVVWCGIGNIYISAVLEQVVINLQRIHQVAPHCFTSSSYTNCTPGALAMTRRGSLPLFGGLQHAV